MKIRIADFACCLMMPYAMGRPRPVPCPTSFVVKNGSNIVSSLL